MTKELPMTNDQGAALGEVNVGEDIFWQGAHSGVPMALGESEVVPKPAFDLEERTARFGEAVIRFAKKIPRHPINDRLINQLVGAATSVGANYCEADDGVSRSDFRHRIGVCRKEARESKHFLRMVAVAEESLKPEARILWQEARELHLIFCAIWRKLS